jgi:CheY-like chemotaxis protein
MDEATLQRAVEPFFTTKKAEKGTGLGLSMVHGFAAQSGGALKLQSRIGTGTTAVIVLPVGDELPSPSAKPPSLPPKDGRSTILLVDDELGVREATSDLLRSNGHEVVSVESVAEALRALDRNPRIDAIITDYLMPGQTGADLIERVRVDYPDLPILLITGFMDAAARLSPDVKILPKPFHAEELFGALSEMGVT